VPCSGPSGPPDIIPDIIPVDLVNSVNRIHVQTMEYNMQSPNRVPTENIPQHLQDSLNLQPVDIVDNLPTHVQHSPVSENGDRSGGAQPAGAGGEGQPGAGGEQDQTDARFWSLGTSSSSRGGAGGITMPTHKDSEHYNMGHRRRGRAFIFNHMNFEGKLQLKARNGTHCDRDNLKVVLRQLDFEVEVHNDLPCREIERILEQASMEDHSEADCILVTVLSHGELGILYASDHPYKPDNLWGYFTADKCPTLAGKPKMFFIQACQGDRLDSGVKMVSRTDTDAGPVSYKIPTHADFLIAYSTIPGFYSWRNTTAGSWFVQALCHVLQREGNSRDLLSILTRVCRKVAFDFQSNVPGDYVMHDKKQIPCITSMLTRDIVFHRK
jgi:caspase 7